MTAVHFLFLSRSMVGRRLSGRLLGVSRTPSLHKQDLQDDQDCEEEDT